MRVLYTILGLFFALYACALTPVTVALDWYINPDHAPLLIAQQMGYFTRQGLQVNFIEPSNVTEATELVATKQATFGIDYEPHTLLAIVQGLPIIRTATLVAAPLSCITVLANSGITDVADLKGKAIGYSGSDLTVLKAMLAFNGIHANQVKLININLNLSQALLSKQVAAVYGMFRNVEPVVLQSQGIATRLFYPEQNGIPSYDELIIIANKTVNPKLVKAFNLALDQSMVYLKAHPKTSFQLADQAYRKQLAPTLNDQATNAKIWLATLPYFADDVTTLNDKDYQAFNRFLQIQGLIHTVIPLEQYTGGLKNQEKVSKD